MAELITMKVTPAALKTLRIIAAHTEETQYEILERLLSAELKRVVTPVTVVTRKQMRAKPAPKR